MTFQETPRIYVACLHCYNCGRLHGEWINADQEPEDLLTDTQDMLKKCPDGHPSEEWAIHDHDNFGGAPIEEYASFDTVAQYAALIEKYGSELAGYAISRTFDADEAEAMLEHYGGSYDSLEDWAQEMLEQDPEYQAIPERLKRYFDFSSYVRDAETGGDIYSFRANGQTHIFL